MNRPEVPLRFHHLARIKQAMQMGSTETANFSLYNAKVLVYPENYSVRTLDNQLYYFDLMGEWPDGQSDILTNRAEVNRTGRLRSALDRYLKLSASTPLRLISLGQDWICECAVGGIHCIVRDRANLIYEKEIAERFGDRKREMKIKGPYFMRNIKNEGISVFTRMGVVREILSTIPSISFLFYQPQDI